MGFLLNQIPSAVMGDKQLEWNDIGNQWRRQLNTQVLFSNCSKTLWKFKLSEMN